MERDFWDDRTTPDAGTVTGLTQDEIVRRWPDYTGTLDSCRRAHVDFEVDADSRTPGADERVVRDYTRWEDTTAISSELKKGLHKGKHILLLDLDVPHVYVPSTQDGHGHLAVFVPMDKWEMQNTLDYLAKVGVLEQGYVDSAAHRGAAWLRTPWTRKEINGDG